MVPAPTIAGIRIHSPPLVRPDGDEVLAHLTVEWGPWLLVGAGLVRSQSGDLRLRLPGSGRTYRVRLQDQDSYVHLRQLALDAYRGITGRDPAAQPLAKASPILEPSHDAT